MLNADRFFFHPNTRNYGSPRELGLDHQDVSFAGRSGLRLHGWFFAARGPARGTVLHLHGNAGNITGHFQNAAWLCEHGLHLLCFDYRGYGRSQGRITRAGAVDDAHAALDYLLAREDVDPQRIAVFGQSLGGAIAIVLAADRPELRAVAADGAFSSYRAIAAWHIRQSPLLCCVAWWVPRLAMSGDHEPLEAVGRIAPRPLLIIHGTDDQVVPVEMARELHERAHEPKRLILVESADHYDPLRGPDSPARGELADFLRQTLA